MFATLKFLRRLTARFWTQVLRVKNPMLTTWAAISLSCITAWNLVRVESAIIRQFCLPGKNSQKEFYSSVRLENKIPFGRSSKNFSKDLVSLKKTKTGPLFFFQPHFSWEPKKHNLMQNRILRIFEFERFFKIILLLRFAKQTTCCHF